jgi:uroporphyrinogen-III synthase
MALTALITRPDDDAEPLAAALIARGIAVAREPLIAIKPIANASLDLEGVQALLFTSANGVRAFAGLSPRREIAVFAVGDATARAARSAGFDKIESASGTVEDLARLVAARLDPKNGALFHAAGSAVAGDLAGLLGQKGFDLRRAMLYEAETAAALSEETKARLERGEIGLVLLFSPRTAETFVKLVREAGDGAARGVERATALCLSPAVAKAAEGLAWRRILTAAKPDLPALLALVDQAVEAERPVAETTDRAASESAGAAATPAPAEIEAALKRMARRPAPARRFVLAAALLILIVAALASRPIWQPFVDRLTTPGETIEPVATGEPPAPPPAASGVETAATAPSGGAPASTAAPPSTAPSEPPPAIDAGAADGTSEAIDALKMRAAQLESDLALTRAAMEKAAAERGALWERVGALEKRLGEMQAEMTDLANAQSAASQAAAPALPADIAALPAEVADLRGKMEALTTAPAQAPAENGAIEDLKTSLDRLANENAALKSMLEQTARRLASLEARAAGGVEAREAALLLATARLKSAVEAGRPYATELAALDSLAAGESDVAGALAAAKASLAPSAAAGIPTTAALLQQFPAVAQAALAVSGGALAEAASGRGWLDRLLARLSRLVIVRPSDGSAAGDSVSARIARAETKAAAGDLAGTAAELDGLGGGAAEAVKEWRSAAAARLAAEPALDSLEQAALARVAQPDGAGADSGGG